MLNHSAHNIDAETRYCPECEADWRGAPIPEKYRKFYAANAEFFSRLIGVEIPGKYDGVDHWLCPDCKATFKRTFNR